MVKLYDARGSEIAGTTRGGRLTHTDGNQYVWRRNEWTLVGNPTSAISSTVTTQQQQQLLKSPNAIIADIIKVFDGDWTLYTNLMRLPNGIIQYTPEPSISWVSENTLETAIKNRIEETEIEKEKFRISLESASIGSAAVLIPTSSRAFMIVAAIVVGLGAVIVSRFFDPDYSLNTITTVIDTALLVSGFFLGGFIIMRMREAKTVAREGAKLYWQNSLSTD